MNVLDIALVSVLIAAVIVSLAAACWALAYRGRTRWSAENRGDRG